MTTLPLKINKTSNDKLLAEFESQYTGLFYHLYNNFELSQDKNERNKLLEKFYLFDISMMDDCIEDVEAKLDNNEVQKQNKKNEIKKIEHAILNGKFVTKAEKRNKFKMIQKLATAKRNLNKNICFGGKSLLRKITNSKQKSDNAYSHLTQKEIKYIKEKCLKLYKKYVCEFRDKRKLGVYLFGNSCETGNRKVDFDLINNRILFKPSRENHIEIIFNSSKKQDIILRKLNEMALMCLIPITVRIDSKNIYLIYDEERINGYAFDKNGYKKHINDKKIKDKEHRKEVYKSFCEEQKRRQLKGKIENRFVSVDINPHEIGIVIADKIKAS